LGQLDEIAAVAEWDQAVNMPERAGPSRAEALAGLARLRHELLSRREVGDLIQAARAETQLGDWERANLTQMQRWFRRATAVEPGLVEASARADRRSEQAWRRYRAENDFASFAPHLEEVLSLKRQVAQALADSLGTTPYDALLDEFEPGAHGDDIAAVFDELRDFLPDFTRDVLDRQLDIQLVQPRGPFPVERQRALGLKMMQAVGFNLEQGRLDVSHHPFCGGVSSDVRITTRYDEGDFTSALMGVLHESGHGKYEQGLPEGWRHQPIGLARGMVLHESQSLLLEMQVCRGEAFLQFATPYIREAFPEAVAEQPDAFSFDNLRRLYHRVQRSLIRVDADEVTYPAHVIMRFDLERALIDGRLTVRDLPDAWAEQMQALLHLDTRGNDRDGCMQDVHWPSGAFGYFPLYTLGAMVAAQLFAAARTSIPNIAEQIERGQFAELDAWLGEHVWQQASRHSTDEVLERATGSKLDARYFIAHLEERYGA
jgi:carboxypeptidase Taq